MRVTSSKVLIDLILRKVDGDSSKRVATLEVVSGGKTSVIKLTTRRGMVPVDDYLSIRLCGESSILGCVNIDYTCPKIYQLTPKTYQPSANSDYDPLNFKKALG